jgi:hypothetical protein
MKTVWIYVDTNHYAVSDDASLPVFLDQGKHAEPAHFQSPSRVASLSR